MDAQVFWSLCRQIQWANRHNCAKFVQVFCAEIRDSLRTCWWGTHVMPHCTRPWKTKQNCGAFINLRHYNFQLNCKAQFIVRYMAMSGLLRLMSFDTNAFRPSICKLNGVCMWREWKRARFCPCGELAKTDGKKKKAQMLFVGRGYRTSHANRKKEVRNDEPHSWKCLLSWNWIWHWSSPGGAPSIGGYT